MTAAAAILSQIDSNYAAICVYFDRTSQLHSCILGPMVWNAAGILLDRQNPCILLKALFGYRDRLDLIQATAYAIFLVTVGSLDFQKLGSPSNVASKNTHPARDAAS